MIKEIHGIADARKVTMMKSDVVQDVTVEDGDGEVLLGLTTSSYPAGLSPERAEFIAKLLVAAAKRVRPTPKQSEDADEIRS